MEEWTQIVCCTAKTFSKILKRLLRCYSKVGWIRNAPQKYKTFEDLLFIKLI